MVFYNGKNEVQIVFLETLIKIQRMFVTSKPNNQEESKTLRKFTKNYFFTFENKKWLLIKNRKTVIKILFL